MYFTEQYQKQSFVMDHVMNIRFPRAFAAGKMEYQGRTYHFYTKESLQAFEKAPSEYVETRVVATAVCVNAGNDEANDNPLDEGGL